MSYLTLCNVEGQTCLTVNTAHGYIQVETPDGSAYFLVSPATRRAFFTACFSKKSTCGTFDQKEISFTPAGESQVVLQFLGDDGVTRSITFSTEGLAAIARRLSQ